nr:BMP family ABC transporter substrate-binding protein [Acidimicrobiia bacterium]
TAQLMLALYRAGRSADALRTFERFRRTVGDELGIDPSPELCRLEEQILLHDSRLQLRRPQPVRATVTAPTTNPYHGLRPFGEDDAGSFFGRERLIAEVVRRIDDGERLITMIGASGSGKSSAVRAGLIPSIRKGAVGGSDQWLIAHMLPGSDPFIELEAALLRSTLDTPDSLSELLQSEDGSGFLRAALRLLPTESSRMVLVVDQFEELFTLVDDEELRWRFLDHLLEAIDDAYGRVVVVTTLRADFYGRPLEHPEFGTKMAAGVVNVVPLTSDELEAAALEPARRSGVTLEPAVLAELIADVLGQPGALPMFQYTLTELFDRRVGDVLSIETYRSIGGVQGALTKTAEELYGQLSPSEQGTAKQLFLRLVTIAEHDEWSRRRVRAGELIDLGVDVVTMQKAIDLFTRHRLLSLDRDQATGAPTVEVAHEALLSGWQRLRDWIEQNREDLVRHRELAVAAGRWDASGRDRDYVYVGGRLDEALQWNEQSAIDLTERERSFLDAGVARREEEAEAERDRLEQQERLERTARWRTRGLVASMVVLVGVVAAVLWAVTRSEGPKVALVYTGAEATAVQQLIFDGWEQAQRDFDIQAATVVPLIDPEEDLRNLADAGYELIITSLFDQGFYAEEVAPDYPETWFVALDGSETTTENVTGINIVREKGAFLVGAAAALQSETGRVGFVGAMQQNTSDARRAAFTHGARSIDPDIVVDAFYMGPKHWPGMNFYDIELGRTTAEDMYRAGADVIHHSASRAAEGIAAAAAELSDELGRQLWVIGSEVSEQRTAPPTQQPHFLTSMWKRWDRALIEAVDSYLAGELAPGLQWLDLDVGAIDYDADGYLSTEQIDRLEQIRADILAGRLEPSSVAVEPPRWNLTPTTTFEVVYDGQSCNTDFDRREHLSGEVIRANIRNESSEVVGVAVGLLDNDLDPAEVWTTPDIEPWDDLIDPWFRPLFTLTAPGAENAISLRLTPDSFVVGCRVGDEVLPGTVITARFETTCTGPPVESADPVDVIRALGAALNRRDAGAVCALFAEDGLEMAATLTGYDDDPTFGETTMTEYAESEGVVSWTGVYTPTFGNEQISCFRAEVDGGKILWMDAVDCDA